MRRIIRHSVYVLILLIAFAGMPKSVEASEQVKLYGYVRDAYGAPVAKCYIDASDKDYVSINNTYSTEQGYYELDVPKREFYHLWAGKTDQYLFTYVPQIKKVTSGQVAFNLSPGANIVINAYNEQGNLLRDKEFKEVTHSKVFITNLNDIPEYSYLGAVHDDQSDWNWDSTIPSIIVLPKKLYKIHVQWEVPEFGSIVLSADNEGKGYSVGKQGEKIILNLNYEIAKSKLAMLKKEGHSIMSKDIEACTKHIKAAEYYLSQSPPDMKRAVSELNLSLKRSLWTHEQLRLNKAKMDIEKYRKGNILLKIVDAYGNALGNSNIDFTQTSHDFLFGANPIGRNGGYDSEIASLMEDAGVNHSYITTRWGIIEPAPGTFNWENIDNYQKIEEQLERGFKLMGALSLWFCPNSDFSPYYQKDISFEDLKENVYNHMYTLASRYKGKIDVWEINEMNLAEANVLNLTLEQRLEICQVFTRAVKQANPQAKIINGSCALPYEFANSIPFPKLLEGDMPADIIGLEFYYTGVNTDGYQAPVMDLASVSNLLNQYAAFGKPIYIKELSAPSSQVAGSPWWHQHWDEQAQAEYVEKFYTIAFSKPTVQAITWSWGISDEDAFIIDGGLLGPSLKPKPAYFTLKRLIESWATSGSGVTDSNGEYNLKGFAGNYDVTVRTPEGKKLRTTIHVSEQKTNGLIIEFPVDVKDME